MSTSSCGVEVDRGAQELREDLERRLSLATRADTVRGMFFLGALEAVRALEGEEGVRHCLEAGGEPRFVEFFNYPVSTYLRVNDVAARLLGPRCGGWEEAQRQLGRRAMEDMLKSAAGKALLLLSRGETRRLVGNLPSAYRAAVNYGERSVVWEGASRGRLLMLRDFLPCAFHEGVVLAALERMKARAVAVRGSRMGLLDAEYLVSWE
jgi:uncharacterized protein (TIGR02265 family)